MKKIDVKFLQKLKEIFFLPFLKIKLPLKHLKVFR